MPQQAIPVIIEDKIPRQVPDSASNTKMSQNLYVHVPIECYLRKQCYISKKNIVTLIVSLHKKVSLHSIDGNEKIWENIFVTFNHCLQNKNNKNPKLRAPDVANDLAPPEIPADLAHLHDL